MRSDITPGATFPDYELPDHTGRLRRLSETQGGDPLVVVLAREAYSAKDQVQHEGLVQLWREMKPGIGYCRMVTITTTSTRRTVELSSAPGVSEEDPSANGRADRHRLPRPRGCICDAGEPP